MTDNWDEDDPEDGEEFEDSAALNRLVIELAERSANEAEPRREGDLTDKELQLLSGHFERRDQAEGERLASAAVENAFQRDRRIDELEALREQDFDEYSRRGGSDELLRLLKSE